MIAHAYVSESLFRKISIVWSRIVGAVLVSKGLIADLWDDMWTFAICGFTFLFTSLPKPMLLTDE